MVRRCACGLGVILPLFFFQLFLFFFFFVFFFLFFFFFNLVFYSCDTMTWVTCGRNSSYSFIPNFLKLCRCFFFLSWSEDVHELVGLSPHHFIYFFSNLSTFFRSWLVSEQIPCGCNPSYSFPPIILNYAYLFYMVWWFGMILPLLFIIFSTVLTWFFLGRFSIGIDTCTLWAELLLEFSTNHFETMHICSTWSEDVRVVLGLSSYHTDLKVTTLYWQSHDVGGCLSATGF